MRRLIANLQYATTPALITLSLLGVLRGGDWVWLGAALLAAAIIADTILTTHTRGTGKDAQGRPLGLPWFLNALIYLTFPLFVAQQLVLAWRLHGYVTGTPFELPPEAIEILAIQTTSSGWEVVGATISVGIWQGMGIVFGHELSHTKGWSFVLSRWIMALSGTAHFSIAHVYNHHIDLGDASDPATAPRGRSLYQHFFLSHFGQSTFVARAERQRLENAGKAVVSLRNRWIRGYLMSVPTIALFGIAGGWTGIAVLAGVWLISNFELEVLNYLEHYGLVRVADQPIEHRHSWDNDTVLTSVAFIEIGRQGDHHVRGETRFWDLEPTGAPNYGWGYLTLLVLALVPPVWHAFMKPKLAAWDHDFATAAERAIAESHNRRSGYGSARPTAALA